MINKYIKIYNKRNIMLALFCSIIVFIPLFIVALLYDVVREDVLVSFAPFVIAAICVAVASLFTIRFKRLINEQEQQYSVVFQDEDVVHLETTLYLSKDWLIWAGSLAFYKRHIKAVNTVRRYGRAGSSNEVIIKTVDNKPYKLWCLNSSNIQELKKWCCE